MFALQLSKVLIASALLGSARAMCLHGTTFMRREEGHVPVATFAYGGERGPLNWAGLDAGNDICRKGSLQSPIVLSPAIPYATSKPKVYWPSVRSAEFENLGSTLEVIVEGVLEFGNKTYILKQFHFHTPSEHRINDEYYPIEVHFVHQAEDQSITVVAVPFQLTEDSSTTRLLTSVITNLDEVTTPGTVTETGPLDFAPIARAVSRGPLFQYTGSLTTPPCKEGVQFLVLETPLAINVKTFNALKKVMKFNSRYTQNAPTKTNLLELAKEYAVQQDGGSDLADVDALVAALNGSGKKLHYQTVTTAKTTVTLD